MRLVPTQQMTPTDARVALAGAVVAMRSYALLLEMNGFHSAADGLTNAADLVTEARETWERFEGGFEDA